MLESWALLGCARLLLERTLRRHEKERQPAVLARAGELFAKVTQGRYRSLLPSVGDENSSQAIRVVASSGAEIEASSLSRGSIEQLYLCLRIGLAETFAERSEALPLILDDVLVNFDPSRAAAVVEVLAETAERHQVLFFTCHPHLERPGSVRCAAGPGRGARARLSRQRRQRRRQVKSATCKTAAAPSGTSARQDGPSLR